MLILDESESITTDQNDRTWRSFIQLTDSLPAQSRFSLIRFADRAKIEIPWTTIGTAEFYKFRQLQQPPRHRFLDKGATDINAALKLALHQSSTENPGIIVMSSDGIATTKNQGSSIEIIHKNPDLSLFYLQQSVQQIPLRINSINLPQRVQPGQSLPVSLAIKSTVDTQGVLEITNNNQLVYQQPVKLQSGTLQILNSTLPTTGYSLQKLEFIIRDQQQNIIDRLTRVVDARDGKKLLYIGKHQRDSSINLALLDGWKTTRQQPGLLPETETYFNQFDMVLIDDVEADSISSTIIKNLQQSIRQSGTGLIVLGGPHSFGSGGYRHSELEQVLPVTAENSKPLAGAAFLFLVDKSGSMEASGKTHSRLADALRAVSESAKSIRPGDESALLTFDREVQVLLPMKPRANLESRLNQPWKIQPSGGTQLIPALNRSIELLTMSQSRQRYLILVTDGFVEIKDIRSIKAAIKQANIQLIALAIGEQANLDTLEQLSAINGGRVLSIKDTAQLPHFMRNQLEITQKSWNKQPVTPEIVQPVAFTSSINQWQNLPGYQVTRAKPSARIFMTTADGDPLLATNQYGAGRVAALPGGMLKTAPDNLLEPLLNWMNNRQYNSELHLDYEYSAGKLMLIIDAVDSANQWVTSNQAEIILTNPAGISEQQPLKIIAPGQFSVSMKAPSTGIYQANIKINDEQTTHSLYLADNKEHRFNSIAPWLLKSIKNREINIWTNTSLKQTLLLSSAKIETQKWWLLLCLLSYLGLMLVEHSAFFYWLKTNLLKLKQ